MGSLQALWLPFTVQRYALYWRLSGDFTFGVGVNVSVNGRSFLAPTDWQPVQHITRVRGGYPTEISGYDKGHNRDIIFFKINWSLQSLKAH